MSPTDLAVRNAPSQEAYVQRYKAAMAESVFTAAERAALQRLVEQANAITAAYPRISAVPWRFAKTCGVENDWPHTLGDVIVVPCTFFDRPADWQLEVAIHEKLHVFQRLFPVETQELVANAWHLRPQKRLEDIPDKRNNPDVDDYVYGPAGDTWYMAHLYDAGATSIGQAHTYRMPGRLSLAPANMAFPDSIRQFEHPFEIMAELIPQMLMHDVQHAPTKAWMQRWL